MPLTASNSTRDLGGFSRMPSAINGRGGLKGLRRELLAFNKMPLDISDKGANWT